MSVALLQADLQLARDRFRALNRQHWTGRLIGKYRRLSGRRERRLGELADEICRLEKFIGLLRVKQMLESTP